MEIIDTHCHLDVAGFDLDRNGVIERCHAVGISKIIIPAIESKRWENLLDICQSSQGLYPALGLHPVFINQHNNDDINKLENLLDKTSPVAIGEIGLDFYLKDLDKNKQLELFEQQLLIAKIINYPLFCM